MQKMAILKKGWTVILPIIVGISLKAFSDNQADNAMWFAFGPLVCIALLILVEWFTPFGEKFDGRAIFRTFSFMALVIPLGLCFMGYSSSVMFVLAGIGALMVYIYAFMKYAIPPGSFEATIHKYKNYAKYGTDYEFSERTVYGSSRFMSMTDAKSTFTNGSIIFGVADPYVPEPKNFIEKMVFAYYRKKGEK